jgi:hypothetical protein
VNILVREKKDARRKDCLLLAVRFTAVTSVSFSIGADNVKQRLMNPVLVSIY